MIYWLKWARTEDEAAELQAEGWTCVSAHYHAILLQSPKNWRSQSASEADAPVGDPKSRKDPVVTIQVLPKHVNAAVLPQSAAAPYLEERA